MRLVWKYSRGKRTLGDLVPETEWERRELARRLAETRGGIDFRDVWDPLTNDWVRDEDDDFSDD